jgi:hypothetical membrane protein
MPLPATPDRTRIAAWAGTLGSVSFVAVFSIVGGKLPGYNPVRQYISELGLGSLGWIQNANFIIYGGLLLLFALGILGLFQGGKIPNAGPVLLVVIGASLLLSGFFVMDPMSVPFDQMSWHSYIHNTFGAIFFILSPVACFVFVYHFRQNLTWKFLQWLTFIAGVFVAVFVALIMVVGQAEAFNETSLLSVSIGLIQRLAIIPFLAWFFIFSFEVHKQFASR